MTYKDEQGNQKEMSESQIITLIKITFLLEEQEKKVYVQGKCETMCLN
jgi:hypothetical protein